MNVELSTKCPICGVNLMLTVEGTGNEVEHFVSCPRDILGLVHKRASAQAQNMYTLVVEALDASDEIHTLAYERANEGPGGY